MTNLILFRLLFVIASMFFQHILAEASPCPCKDRSLCETVKKIPEKEIFVFMSEGDPTVGSLFDWSKITTVSYPMKSYPYTSKLMCLSHQHSARIVPFVGLGMPTASLTDPIMRQKWVEKHLMYIIDNHLDGINIDIEAAIYENQTSIRNGYSALVLEMKLALLGHNPYAQLSVDVSCAPNLPPRYYNYTALGLLSDFLFVMDYDEGYGHPVSANSHYVKNQLGFMWYEQIGVPANKMVMGLPWYGYGWECSIIKGDKCFPPKYATMKRSLDFWHEPSTTLRFHHHPLPSYCYKDISHIIETQAVVKKWNSVSKTPYFFFKDSSKIRQMQYDDPKSLALKSQLAVKMKLHGVDESYKMDIQLIIDRMALSLNYLREVTDFERKYNDLKRCCVQHPITSLFIMITLCLCSIPVACFTAFAVGSVLVCFTGFLIVEGSLLTVASVILGTVLLLLIILSVCLSSTLLLLFYLTQIAQGFIDKIVSSYKVSCQRMQDDGESNAEKIHSG